MILPTPAPLSTPIALPLSGTVTLDGAFPRLPCSTSPADALTTLEFPGATNVRLCMKVGVYDLNVPSSWDVYLSSDHGATWILLRNVPR